MRTIFAYPSSNMPHATNAALALLERGVLERFVTGFVWRPDGQLGSMLARVKHPAAERLGRELRRRTIECLPADIVQPYPVWDLLVKVTAGLGLGPVMTDRVWDFANNKFDTYVARYQVPDGEAIQAFEYAALASFERAKEIGVARVLHLPSLDSREFEELQRRERHDWPELASPHDAYFNARFERRYERRRAEIALADVIITNSSLTARSHIAAGADPAKVHAVPLAAPPPISDVIERPGCVKRQLTVMWAGPFSLRKGAHYMVEAWKQIAVGGAARLEVYGCVTVPERVVAAAGDDVTFHGSVSRSSLYEAYKEADVLVFPTLSDGFGMVVAEAFAHGLPVITTDQAGAADLVTSDNGLVIPAADPRALADALRWCLDNRSRLAEMRHHALDTARRRQWSAFRRDLVSALGAGYRRAGYGTKCL